MTNSIWSNCLSVFSILINLPKSFWAKCCSNRQIFSVMLDSCGTRQLSEPNFESQKSFFGTGMKVLSKTFQTRYVRYFNGLSFLQSSCLSFVSWAFSRGAIRPQYSFGWKISWFFHLKLFSERCHQSWLRALKHLVRALCSYFCFATAAGLADFANGPSLFWKISKAFPFKSLTGNDFGWT